MKSFDEWYDAQPLVLLDRRTEHRITWEAAQAALNAERGEPEQHMNERVECALLYALWNHQGGNSKIGQPIRKMLGIGEYARLTDEEIAKAKRYRAPQPTPFPAWTKVTDRLPDPEKHSRVLIYTEGYDFNGEQFFDVKAECLNECYYDTAEDQPEVCLLATHWMPLPKPKDES